MIMKILSIAKINILSVIALGLLLLATSFKLLAKALEKFLLICGISIIWFIALCIFMIALEPMTFLKSTGKMLGNFLMYMLLLIVFAGIVFVLIYLAITICASLISAIVQVAVYTINMLISFFDFLYELVYGRYLSLYSICNTEYQCLNTIGKKPFFNHLSCFLFTFLNVVNKFIIIFMTYAKILLNLCSLSLLVVSVYALNQNSLRIFGINLWNLFKKFSTYNTVIYIIIYIITLLAIAFVLFLIGVEWNEWGQEMAILTSEAAQSINLVAQSPEQHTPSSQSFSYNQDCVLNHYFEMYASHVNTFDNFLKEIQCWLDTSTNYSLKNNCLEYINTFQEIQLLLQSNNSKTIQDHENFISLIEALSKLKEEIYALAQESRQHNENSSSHNAYFYGCDDIDSLEKRYKALCKVYHPDNSTGNGEIFKSIHDQYLTSKEKML